MIDIDELTCLPYHQRSDSQRRKLQKQRLWIY